MSTLVLAPIAAIDPNPFRRLGDYPYVQRKLEALKHSIADVGLWEGVIGRKKGNRFEIAFGHHRVRAAELSDLPEVPLIVRDLDDEQMLQFMGRENMEDYNADFLTMLETWEAGARWVSARAPAENAQTIDIARLLGWTRPDEDGSDRITSTAAACNAASFLRREKYITRADLTDLTVNEAEKICGRAQATIERLETMGKQGRRPAEEIAHAKKQVGKAVKETARQSRAGQVAHKDLRGQVDLNTYRHAKSSKRPSPLFEVFGKQLADSIGKMLDRDSASEKLAEVQKALPQVTLDDDKLILKRLNHELGLVAERAGIWQKRLTSTEQKVSQFPQIGS